MICKNCGTELVDDAEFCHKCGCSLVDEDKKPSEGPSHVKHSVIMPEKKHYTYGDEDEDDYFYLPDIPSLNFWDKKIKKKYVYWTLAAIVALLLLVSISNAASCVFDFLSKPKAEVVSIEDDKPENWKAELKERINQTNTNEKDIELQTVIRTTDWIKGSETDALWEAWRIAGGKTDLPSVSDFNTKVNPIRKDANFDNCAILIGSFRFVNLSQDRIKLDQYTNSVKANLNIFENQAIASRVYKTVFNPQRAENSQTLRYGSLGGNRNVNTLILDDELKVNPYGPYPFMIVAYDVFDSKNKNKEIKFDHVSLQNQIWAGSAVDYFGDKKNGFKVTWEADKTW